MSSDKWIFTKDQRDEVCKGELCPACLGKYVKMTGYNFDGVKMNAGYECQLCDEVWEGY